MPQDRHARLPGWLGGALVVGACAAAFYLEHQRPLRRETESKLRRDLRNLSVAALSAATLQVLEKPVVEPLAKLVERRRWGIVPQLGLPRPVQDAVAVLLMDYTLYVWHVWTHRIPFLWRFHLVHHADLDCSASTAIRFHFGEMVLSVPYRAAQVLVIGTSPRALHLWQRLVLVSITFHHSNLRLPKAVESALVGVIVTPRMHGIHHSADVKEADSNWSSGLTIWDRLHGTLRLDVAQEDLTIGVMGFETLEDVAFARLMKLPFCDQRITRGALLLPVSTAPETGHEQDQHSEEFQPPQQHRERQQPLGAIRESGEVARRTDGLAQAGAHIGEGRHRSAGACQEVKTETHQCDCQQAVADKEQRHEHHHGPDHVVGQRTLGVSLRHHGARMQEQQEMAAKQDPHHLEPEDLDAAGGGAGAAP